jgi:hypothetical protein
MSQTALRSFSSCLVLAAAVSGCHMEQRYLTPEGGTVFQLGMSPDTPPLVMTDEAALYSVEMDIPFPLLAPTEAEMSALVAAPVVPFPRAPWLRRGDYEVTVELTMTNLEAERVTATATINGINEFNRYVPGFTIDDEEVIVDFSQWEHTWSLRAGERVSITVREEELDEAAVDLASVVFNADCSALANQIVYFQNQSASDPRSQLCMPAMIPALDGIVLGLRTETVVAGHPAGIAIDASVRLRDVRGRVQGAGQPEWELPVATPFSPPIAEL